MSKLNHLDTAEKMLCVDERIQNWPKLWVHIAAATESFDAAVLKSSIIHSIRSSTTIDC